MEDYSTGNHQCLEAGLSLAIQSLKRVEVGRDMETKQDAQRLRTATDELLDPETHRTPQAKGTLCGLWHRTVGLMEREAEKLYQAWRDEQTENHVCKQLIDAKLHLFFAEHEIFERGDVEGARQELEGAAGFLRAAAAGTSGTRKTKVEALEREVMALASLATNPDQEAHNRYDEALADLRRIIGHM